MWASLRRRVMWSPFGFFRAVWVSFEEQRVEGWIGSRGWGMGERRERELRRGEVAVVCRIIFPLGDASSELTLGVRNVINLYLHTPHLSFFIFRKKSAVSVFRLTSEYPLVCSPSLGLSIEHNSLCVNNSRVRDGSVTGVGE